MVDRLPSDISGIQLFSTPLTHDRVHFDVVLVARVGKWMASQFTVIFVPILCVRISIGCPFFVLTPRRKAESIGTLSCNDREGTL